MRKEASRREYQEGEGNEEQESSRYGREKDRSVEVLRNGLMEWSGEEWRSVRARKC